MPTLAGVLRCVSGRAAIAVEIKNIPGEPAFEPTREPIVERPPSSSVRGSTEWSSWSRSSSIAASKLVAPDVPTGFLTTDLVPPREALAYAVSAGHGMVPHAASIPAGPSLVDEVHAAGLRLGRGPWTGRTRFGCCSIAGSTRSRPTTPGWRSPCSPTTSVREPASPTVAGAPEGPARAFDDLLPPLERARAALTESVPGTRLPGRPLAETLSEFEDGLREVRDGWTPGVRRTSSPSGRRVRGVSRRRSRSADRVRTEGVQPEGFEADRFDRDLLAPLDARTGVRALRELRG